MLHVSLARSDFILYSVLYRFAVAWNGGFLNIYKWPVTTVHITFLLSSAFILYRHIDWHLIDANFDKGRGLEMNSMPINLHGRTFSRKKPLLSRTSESGINMKPRLLFTSFLPPLFGGPATVTIPSEACRWSTGTQSSIYQVWSTVVNGCEKL
jgi:hypothetical protein